MTKNDNAALTLNGLGAMATEVGTDTGPGTTTREFNRALIEKFRANEGLVPGELQGVPFLLLTTTSVKNGARMPIPLVYHRIDGRLLVVASTGGGPRNPGWFNNLVRDPRVVVELGRETFEAIAVVLASDDRDAMFAAVVRSMPTFGGYQARTERIIPIVELVRAS